MRNGTQIPARIIAALLVCSFAFSTEIATAQSPLSAEAENLHWAAWDNLLDAGADAPEARYAPYAFRSLAVHNPEIYLKADIWFSHLLGEWPGSQLAYLHPNRFDVQFFWKLRNIKIDGPGFSWRMWSIVPDSIRDTDADLKVSWLDRRLPPAGVMLKSHTPALRTAEAALMMYVQNRSLGTPVDDLFIVIDREGRGYLVADGHATLGGMHRRDVDLKDINPVLVFNEEAVYYPLFNRDDRHADAQLKRLLDQLGTQSTLSLPTEHLRRISKLRSLTTLPTDGVLQMAMLAATGIRDTEHPGVIGNWARAWNDTTAFDIACVRLLTDKIFHAANRLSRHTAKLAASVAGDSLGDQLAGLQDDYLALCGHTVVEYNKVAQPVEAWGNLWAYGLLELCIDDLARTNGGAPSSQVLAMAAILDLRDLDYVIVEGLGNRLDGLEQQWLFTEGESYRFDLGNWLKEDPSDIWSVGRVLSLTGCRLPGGVAVHFGRESACSDRGSLSMINGLNRVCGLFPDRAIAIRYQGVMIRRAGFMNDLAQDNIPTTIVTWPDTGEQ